MTKKLDENEEEISEGVIFSSDAARPGIVHRLDKDTSGLLIVSKNAEIHAKLAKQFEDRTVNKAGLTISTASSLMPHRLVHIIRIAQDDPYDFLRNIRHAIVSHQP